MKYYIAGCVVLLSLLVGCEPFETETGPIALDSWMVQATDDAAICNAIIRQHTLYPYQFIANSAELNALGARDATVLASHYKEYPGRLNVRRGPESDALYRKRVAKVVDYLRIRGVATDKIKVEDKLAGGDGIASELAVLIIAADAKGYKKATTPKRAKNITTSSGGSSR